MDNEKVHLKFLQGLKYPDIPIYVVSKIWKNISINIRQLIFFHILLIFLFFYY